MRPSSALWERAQPGVGAALLPRVSAGGGGPRQAQHSVSADRTGRAPKDGVRRGVRKSIPQEVMPKESLEGRVSVRQIRKLEISGGKSGRGQ